MAGGSLIHPLLLSTELGFDEVVIQGNSVPFTHVFFSWVAILFIIVVGLILKNRLKLVPTGTQNLLEVIVDGLEKFIIDNLGEAGKRYVPFLLGIFLYILICNLFGLVPGFDAPSGNLNTTASMAVVVFVLYNILGLIKWGPRYIKHFMGPMPVLAPFMFVLEVVSHFVRPVSLTFRLFGNVRGGELILIIFFTLAPIVATLPIYFLFILAKSLQAFIFFMLTMIFIKGAIEEVEH